MNEENKKQAIRKFTPNTKFISLFGAEDIVNEKDKFRFDDNDDIFVLGRYEFRMIYDGSWANVL